MGSGCVMALFLLLVYGWSITTFVVVFTRDTGFDSDYTLYTLVSAGIIALLETYSILSYCQGDDYDDIPKYIKISIGAYCIWSVYSAAIFFMNSDIFPEISSNSYGGLTLSYLIFFSFPLYLPLVFLAYLFVYIFQSCSQNYRKYLYLPITLAFFIPLAIIVGITFLYAPQ